MCKAAAAAAPATLLHGLPSCSTRCSYPLWAPATNLEWVLVLDSRSLLALQATQGNLVGMHASLREDLWGRAGANRRETIAKHGPQMSQDVSLPSSALTPFAGFETVKHVGNVKGGCAVRGCQQCCRLTELTMPAARILPAHMSTGDTAGAAACSAKPT